MNGCTTSALQYKQAFMVTWLAWWTVVAGVVERIFCMKLLLVTFYFFLYIQGKQLCNY